MNETECIKKIEPAFASRTAANSGVDLFSCFQCEKCTNGCPVTFAMDYYPHQIIRMVQMGLEPEILEARSIWVCASCETCFTRCPNEIDIPKLMDYLKSQAIARGYAPAEEGVAAFHKTFLSNIRRFGRVNESLLMGVYQLNRLKSELKTRKINTRGITKNLGLGLKMLKRGRLSLLPRRTGVAAIRKYFRKFR